MGIIPLDREGKKLKLLVFLKNFERKRETLHWIGFYLNSRALTIEDVTYHELLHACGDAKWRGYHDGVVRHNIIGIKAIQELLRAQV